MPCIQYFGNLALQLRERWTKLDQKVQSLTCDEHEINQIFGWIEDQKDVLEYIADILVIENLDQKIKDTIMLSLLNFAYLPTLVNSLVII